MEKDYYYFGLNDFLFAKEGLKKGFYDNTAALCAQAAEKFLKHILVTQMDILAGDKLLATHNLRMLATKAASKYPSFTSHISEINMLKDYYYTQRYPNDNYIDIDKSAASVALKTAEIVKTITEDICGCRPS